MPKVFNVHGDDWDGAEDRSGWCSKEAWVGARIGAQLIGGTIYQLEPGQRLWPYHTHHANEEWVIVVQGRPTLRTPEGEHDLEEGDVVAFVRGPDGLHQMSNRTGAPLRVLIISTVVEPELVQYPDSGKYAARDANGRVLLFRPEPTLDYWDGED